jgi:hypothetical protein
MSSIPNLLDFQRFHDTFAQVDIILLLLGHLQLRGMWFGVDPRMDAKKTCF